ncbi:hypothetical protein AB0I93_38625 [Streptomyces sp. NPDC049967]|uniref:hypothetical protein n=1 Tax=unclassified Streptomyces TaxID=2593676 RepID=UPI00093F46B8|nr:MULTISPECIES: hypothetical protein [unclassified Streptomyces]NED82123.1 hypothetical protein [Streptomyces sp. SID11233]OKK07519.1 hypothetical protein AMK09_36215 [Streptomyces sp. CB02488]WRZ10191.1 hypothetical protein OG892_04995 [Streptomyces sp. NBC_00341]WSJ21142.1 hypothetical protein OG384_03580 [Streptomyces sp. NBC_01324]
MNNSIRTAAAAAALVAGLVTVSGTANAAERPDRITGQEQLAQSIAQAVAAEQQSGAVTDGVIGGIVINPSVASSC